MVTTAQLRQQREQQRKTLSQLRLKQVNISSQLRQKQNQINILKNTRLTPQNVTEVRARLAQLQREFSSLNRQRLEQKRTLQRQEEIFRGTKKQIRVQEGKVLPSEVTKRAKIKTITVSIGGARNRIETRKVTKNKKTTTTFLNRDTGSLVQVGRSATYASLSAQQKKSLGSRVQPRKVQKKETQATAKPLKKSIEQVLPGVKLKTSSQLFTKEEMKQIQSSKNPKQSAKALLDLKRRQEDAKKQQKRQLDNFLKATTKPITTAADLKRIEKAIDAEIKRQNDPKLKFALAKTDFVKEATALGNQKASRIVNLVNPIFWKKVSVELLKIVWDIGNAIGGGSVNALVYSYRYGQNLVKRGLWSKTNNPFVKDIKELASKPYKITRYVLTHPAESAAIVGLAATVGGTTLLSTLKNKPEKAVAEAIFILTPPTAIARGVKLTVSAARLIVQTSKKIDANWTKAMLFLFETDLKRKPKTITNTINNVLLDTTLSQAQKKEKLYKLIGSKSFQNLVSIKDFKRVNFKELEKLFPGTKALQSRFDKELKADFRKQLQNKLNISKENVGVIINRFKTNNRIQRTLKKLRGNKVSFRIEDPTFSQRVKELLGLPKTFIESIRRKQLNKKYDKAGRYTYKNKIYDKNGKLITKETITIANKRRDLLLKLSDKIGIPKRKIEKEITKISEKSKLSFNEINNRFNLLKKDLKIIKEEFNYLTRKDIIELKIILFSKRMFRRSTNVKNKMIKTYYDLILKINIPKFTKPKLNLKERITKLKVKIELLNKRIKALPTILKLKRERAKYIKEHNNFANRVAQVGVTFRPGLYDSKGILSKKKKITIKGEKPKDSRQPMFKAIGKRARLQSQIKLRSKLIQETEQVTDRTPEVIRKSWTLNKGDIVRFKIGEIETQRKKISKSMNEVRDAAKNNVISKKQARNLRGKLIRAIFLIDITRKARRTFKVGDRIPVKGLRGLEQTRIPDKLKDKTSIRDITGARDYKRIFDKAFDRIKIQKQKVVPKKIQRTKLKRPTRPPVKPKRIPLLKLRTKNLQKKGSRLGYIIQIKEGNKIVRKSSTLLPRNRATNIMRTYLDNNVQASGQLVAKGRTSIVDV